MTPDQRSLAKDYRNLSQENVNFACRRGCELADEFSRLEVQIATILFAFAGLFVGFFSDKSLEGLSSNLFTLRLAFAFALFFLIASLASGLLHIKRKEKFWDQAMEERIARVRNWNQIIRNDGDFDEGYAFHMGISRGAEGMTSSPLWTWILQTICLGFAVLLLFVLAMVFLFK